MKNGKAAGLGSINLELINKMLQGDGIPQEMKIRSVVPIQKEM
jgi:hypothetical protein